MIETLLAPVLVMNRSLPPVRRCSPNVCQGRR
jgi:hypothetical protein